MTFSIFTFETAQDIIDLDFSQIMLVAVNKKIDVVLNADKTKPVLSVVLKTGTKLDIPGHYALQFLNLWEQYKVNDRVFS